MIRQNLFDDVDGAAWSAEGHWLQLTFRVADVVVDHNTALNTGSTLIADGVLMPGFVFTSNIAMHGPYGVKGSGTGSGNNTLNAYFPGFVFARNVLVGASPSDYPADNFYPGSLDEVGFVNPGAGDYRLAVSSPYNNAGSDGTDAGAHFE